jgi:hypothetical protein
MSPTELRSQLSFVFTLFLLNPSIAHLRFCDKLHDILDVQKEACMVTYRKELWFHLNKRRGPVNIIASVFINSVEEGLHEDFEQWLEKLAP